MNTVKLASTMMLLAALVAGCAADHSRTKPPDDIMTTPEVNASVGAPNPATQLALAAWTPSQRSREEVHAEAVEAARNHRATLSEDLDFLTQR